MAGGLLLGRLLEVPVALLPGRLVLLLAVGDRLAIGLALRPGRTEITVSMTQAARGGTLDSPDLPAGLPDGPAGPSSLVAGHTLHWMRLYNDPDEEALSRLPEAWLQVQLLTNPWVLSSSENGGSCSARGQHSLLRPYVSALDLAQLRERSPQPHHISFLTDLRDQACVGVTCHLGTIKPVFSCYVAAIASLQSSGAAQLASVPDYWILNHLWVRRSGRNRRRRQIPPSRKWAAGRRPATSARLSAEQVPAGYSESCSCELAAGSLTSVTMDL